MNKRAKSKLIVKDFIPGSQRAISYRFFQHAGNSLALRSKTRKEKE